MKKKTIKFYFFNGVIKSSPANYLFCFSKKAFRENKQKLKYTKRYRRNLSNRYVRTKFYEFVARYKQFNYLIWSKIILNQWNLNQQNPHLYFIKSFYVTPKWFNKSIKYKDMATLKFKLWFYFKNRRSYDLRQFIFNYSKLGTLSSHVVHILSRKNLSYQVWSKYRPKLYNMNLHSWWFYNVVKYNLIHCSFLLFLTRGLSSNPGSRAIWTDENFNPALDRTVLNLCVSIRTQFFIPLSLQTKLAGPIYLDFSNEDLSVLRKNYERIDRATNISNPKTQMDDQKKLEQTLDLHSVIMLSRFFIFTQPNSLNSSLEYRIWCFIKYYNLL